MGAAPGSVVTIQTTLRKFHSLTPPPQHLPCSTHHFSFTICFFYHAKNSAHLLPCCPALRRPPSLLSRSRGWDCNVPHFHKLLIAPPPSQWPSPTLTTAICLLRGSTWAAGKVGQPVERAAGQETGSPPTRRPVSDPPWK